MKSRPFLARKIGEVWYQRSLVWLPAVLVMIATNLFTTPISRASGPDSRYGAISGYPPGTMPGIANPAAGAVLFRTEGDGLRVGLIRLGLGFELGQVDDWENNLDDTINKFTKNQTLSNLSAIIDNNPRGGQESALNYAQRITLLVLDELNNNVIAPLNVLQREIAKDGYAVLNLSGDPWIYQTRAPQELQGNFYPLMPVVITHKVLRGSIVFDIDVSFTAHLGLLSEDLNEFSVQDVFDTVSNAIQNADDTINYSLQDVVSDSTLLAKGALVTAISLGYSRTVWRHTLGPGYQRGELFVGVRAKYYEVGLIRVKKRLADFVKGRGTDEFFAAAKKQNFSDSIGTGFGLDCGVLWVSERYRLGATLTNLNHPGFDYTAFEDFADYRDGGSAIKRELAKKVTYVMGRQLHLDGALYTANQHWLAGIGLDANTIEDPVGQKYQWLTLSGGYIAGSWWVPEVHAGLRTNLAGTELSYITAGARLFDSISLDIAYGLDTVTIAKEKKIPRSFMVNLGFELVF